MVAPRLAPIFRIEEATGMTEQEQRGRGIPSIAALKTEYIGCSELPNDEFGAVRNEESGYRKA